MLDRLKAVRAKLMIAFQFDTRWLAGQMNALGLLSDNDYNRICTVATLLVDSDKAEILISALFHKVELQSQNLMEFVGILRNRQRTFQEIIVLLEGKCNTNYITYSHDMYAAIASNFTSLCSRLHFDWLVKASGNTG